MPEPVDPAADYLTTRGGIVRDIEYRGYDAATDAHGEAVACVGVRGQKRKSEENNAKTVRATWRVTGVESEPVMRSLIVDGGETWVVQTVTPDPASETLFRCECVQG